MMRRKVMTDNKVKEGGLGWQSKGVHPKLMHAKLKGHHYGGSSHALGGVVTLVYLPEVMLC